MYTVAVMCDKTDRPPCNPLHDEVLTRLQMFDDIFAQSGVSLDEALDDFVKIEGGEAEHIQYPGEAHISLSCVTTTTSMAVSSSLKTALYGSGANDIITTCHTSTRGLNIYLYYWLLNCKIHHRFLRGDMQQRMLLIIY